MASLISFARRTAGRLLSWFSPAWKRYRGLKRPWQIAIALLLIALIIALFVFLRRETPEAEPDQQRSVTVASVNELAGGDADVYMLGTVRSVSEADILAENGGVVERVHTQVGSRVAAGALLAELENASERAAVLQAEGAYESALASRRIAQVQAENAGESREEAETAARNTYRTAFTTVDTALETQVDLLFGNPTAVGPDLLLRVDSELTDALSRERAALEIRMREWRANLASANNRSPEVLLDEAESVARQLSTFLANLSRAATTRDSNASSTQTAAVASARTSVDTLLATLSTRRDALRAAETAAEVGEAQTESRSGEVASADAQVKSALGSLRAAEASLEKTIVRAPISGTVNYLPIRRGDYVTSLMHVATVAQNGALEIVAYVSESDRDALTVGTEVTIEEAGKGVITSIAPALDPSTRQIEVHVAVTSSAEEPLVSGQSVRIALPNTAVSRPASAPGPLLLPLSAVKLRGDERIVFTVGDGNRLIAHPVEIGQVLGNRIEVRSGVAPDMRIVVDARGRAEGEVVKVKGEGE